MRIPAEVVPLVPNLGKDADDVRKPEPVTSAASIANDLAGTPEQPPPAADQRQGQRQAAADADAQPENAPPAVERRQKERRSEKRPVLLDTRSTRGRRKAGGGDVKINIKV